MKEIFLNSPLLTHIICEQVFKQKKKKEKNEKAVVLLQ